MAIRKIAHPSIDDRKAMGLEAWDRAPMPGHMKWRPAADRPDPVAIAEYLGETDAFDKAIAEFSERYADQNEQDYQDFVKAVRSGRMEAVEGV